MRVQTIAFGLLLSLLFTGCTSEESTNDAQPELYDRCAHGLRR